MDYTHSYRFPAGFAWGTATASYQIEGATGADGRGMSVWDTFCRTAGKVYAGQTGDVACDHYHRYKEDVELMRSLGIKHYRMSVAWPRVIPDGDGAVNEAGLDFYDRLVDALLAAGITPWVTFYHWDLPQALENKGGWRVRSTAEAFGRYAREVVKRLGGRVKHWFTLNEIMCFTKLAYEIGVHAPGAKEPTGVVNQIVHHALLAHGHGVRAVRELGGKGAVAGLVSNPAVGVPAMEKPEYVEAARRFWERENAQLLAPIYLKGYPEWWLKEQAEHGPRMEPGDGELMGSPTDFLGLNIYTGTFVEPASDAKGYQSLILPQQYHRADLLWLNVVPQSIYWAVRHSVDSWGLKTVYITENGAGYADRLTEEGRVVDLDRREYLRNYLISVQRATAEGLPVKGYFLWTLMDNFEWAEGYSKRFGIVYTDYEMQKRIPKLSAGWYSEVIRENRVV